MQKVFLPKVCICVPTYNAMQTIAETLDSLIAQTYSNIEIFIVDNNSTDNTLDIVEAFAAKNHHIKVFSFDSDIGAEGNFSRCIRLASGDYTGIFHADDIYAKDIIEKQVAYFEHYQEVGAVFTEAYNINSAGKIVGKRLVPREVHATNNQAHDFLAIFKLMLKYGNFLICPSALVRTKIYKDEIVSWNGEKYLTSADLDVWLRILLKHKIGIIYEPLMKYRMSQNSFSYRVAKVRAQRHNKFLVLDEYLKHIPRSQLSREDLNNYLFLVLKDNISIAIVLILQDKRKESLRLSKTIFSKKNILYAMSSLHRFKIFLIGALVYLLGHINIGKLGKKILVFFRYGELMSLPS